MSPNQAQSRPVASLSFALSAVVCAACSFALAHAGLALDARFGVAVLPEPLAGFALVALVLWGTPYGLAVGAGLFGAWVVDGTHGARESMSAALALVAGAWSASALLRHRLGFEPRLERVRDALSLLVAAALGSAVQATCAGASAPRADLRAWLAHGLASGVGCLVVVPLVCAWRTRSERAERLARAGDLVASVAGIGVLAALAFSDVVPAGWAHLAAWLAFPLVVWSALRCGPRGASLATFVFAVVAVLLTARGSGPFASGAAAGAAIELTAYLGVLAATGLVVAAFHGQRSRAERRANAERARVELALNGSSGGLWEWDLASGRVEYSTRFRELLGLREEAAAPGRLALHSLVHPDDHAVFDAAVLEHVQRGAPYEVDVRLRRASGESRWFHVRGVAQRDERGEPVRLLGSISDIHAARVAESELLRHVHELEAARDAHERQSHEITLLVSELADARARLDELRQGAPARLAPQTAPPVDFDRTLDELVRLLSTNDRPGAGATDAADAARGVNASIARRNDSRPH